MKRSYPIGLTLSLLVVAGIGLLSGWRLPVDRDQSIYLYGAQQLADGVPPYLSVFDPKGPVSFLVAGAGVALARLVGLGDVTGARAVFAVCALAATALVYAVAHRVWRRVGPACAAAMSFATFSTWSLEVFSGPDPKQLAVAAWMLALWAVLGPRPRWILAGAAAAIAAATWQPIVLAVGASVLIALVVSASPAGRVQPLADAGTADRAPDEDAAEVPDPIARRAHRTPHRPPRRRPHHRPPGRRRELTGATARVLVGAGVVVAALAGWLAATHALGAAIDAGVVFPVRGIEHAASTPGQRLRALGSVLRDDYGAGAVVLVVGVVALLVEAGAVLGRRRGERPLGRRLADPRVAPMVAVLVVPAAYSFFDFQGAPDLFPLLPAACFGIAALAARLLATDPHGPRRRLLVATGSILAVVILGVSAVGAATHHSSTTLSAQRAEACTLRTLTTPRAAAGSAGRTRVSGVWVFGDATALVLTGLMNPDPYIYDGSGQAEWKLRHQPRGIAAWEDQVRAAHPAVLVFVGLRGTVRDDFVRDFVGRTRTVTAADPADAGDSANPADSADSGDPGERTATTGGYVARKLGRSLLLIARPLPRAGTGATVVRPGCARLQPPGGQLS